MSYGNEKLGMLDLAKYIWNTLCVRELMKQDEQMTQSKLNDANVKFEQPCLDN